MVHAYDLPESIVRDMEDKKIDIDLTLSILSKFNDGKYDLIKPVKVKSLPSVDGETVLDLTGRIELTVGIDEAVERLRTIDRSIDPMKYGRTNGNLLVLDRDALNTIGILLLPYVAYGVLNGGSATSYVDTRKNQAFNEKLFSTLEPEFYRLAEMSGGKPKGITPAFVNPDGTPGPSFLLLKFRALLNNARTYTALTGKRFPDQGLFFQMTSVQTDDEVSAAYDAYRTDPFIEPLIRETGTDVTRADTGVQKMIAAYTHSSEGRPRRIFTRANGYEGSTLALPGGHGQNFMVLKNVYRKLHENGKRFAYLGNVDNLGYTIDPVETAILAVTGKRAGFDFSFRTPVDVKGGVLVIDQNGRLNAADIGPAISEADIERAVDEGGDILFNCATGLFDLSWLVENLDYISENLPMRWSDQVKDVGQYSQAEQVTWEVIGMLDDFLIFGIDKYERFLAAKLFIETLLTSGLYSDDSSLNGDREHNLFVSTARRLHAGLNDKLSGVYALELKNGRWTPPD